MRRRQRLDASLVVGTLYNERPAPAFDAGRRFALFYRLVSFSQAMMRRFPAATGMPGLPNEGMGFPAQAAVDWRHDCAGCWALIQEANA